VQDRLRRFEALVGPHFDALYRAAIRLTRRRQDAEDLVQDVCLRAYAEVPALESIDYVLGWLLRIQYRLFVDGLRRRRRSPFVAGAASAEAVDAMACEGPGPEELTEAAAQRCRLEAAWRTLSADQRALLGLHAEGYGLAELERITGRSRNVLSARLHRARRRFAKSLNGALPAGERRAFMEKQNELS
jgi:RNA polymerase sigma-70 factor (ECF subfamily)